MKNSRLSDEKTSGQLDAIPTDSIESDEFEDDQNDVQALGPEIASSTDGEEEPATLDRSTDVSKNTASIREIAQRRKRSQSSEPTTTSAIPSSPAPESSRKIVNQGIDLSRVESSGYARPNKLGMTKPISPKEKKERADDAKLLGVASTYNEMRVIKAAYDKLQKNMSDPSESKRIMDTAKKYISSEVLSSKPFLQSPGKKQSDALQSLGLENDASERAIHMALLDKASESIERSSKNKRGHENTMKELGKYYQTLLGTK